MQRKIKVRIVKETSSKITLYFVTLNRKMPIAKKDFIKRVESGLYEVIGGKSDLIPATNTNA